MLTQLFGIFSQLCHMAGLLVILWGAILLAGAMFGGAGPSSFVKGGALLIFGTWVSGIAG